MTKVILHGALGKAVGRSEWMLDVKSPREAMRAIEANTHRLYSYLLSEQNGEAPYQVIADDQIVHSVEGLAAPISHTKTLHIVPVLAGAGSGGGLLIIIGVVLVLIAVTIMTYGAGSTIVDPLIGSAGAGFGTTAGIFGSYTGMIAFSTLLMGASMIVGGISALLTHDPTAQTNTASLLFNGAVNTTEQGVPVPVGYGELIVGSATISAGVSTQQIPVGISAGLYSYAN